MEDHIRMCRFTHNGQPETGEYIEQEDGTGVCIIDELDEAEGTSIGVIVSHPDCTMPDGISDLELLDVPVNISFSADTDGTDPIPAELRESFAKTRFIVDEYEMGVLSEKEAGEALYEHLFGKGHQELTAKLRAKDHQI